ncbi:MAG: hypothetical protein M3O36_07690 [Myxococcota bacterium]|nr:hypothetical protein [Myxococcota bacterium]
MKLRHDLLGRSLFVGCAAFAAVFPSANARADESADTAAARLLGWDGVTLADSGNCNQAVDKLLRAEKLHHVPTTAGRLGECEVELGKLVDGTERLLRLVREALPVGAPAAFSEAILRAHAVLERALPRVAVLRISVHAPPGVRFRLTVDGEPLPDALIDNQRPTDPGAHRVELVAQGYFGSRKDVTLNDGETKTLSLDLDRNFNAPLALAGPSPARDLSIAPASENSGVRTAPLVALALGAVALGTGVAAGLVVAGKASDLSGSCDATKVCPPNKESEIGSAKTWAMISTTGFVVAGAALGAGLVLLVTGRSESHPPSTHAALEVLLGPTYLGLRGGF